MLDAKLGVFELVEQIKLRVPVELVKPMLELQMKSGAKYAVQRS